LLIMWQNLIVLLILHYVKCLLVKTNACIVLFWFDCYMIY
jgi:hypothetical protein